MVHAERERQLAVAAWLAAQRPDVVALQELNGYTQRRLRNEAVAWGHPHVALLKLQGYPTAITSRQPIVGVQRMVRPGIWHGFLRAETAGIVFYVIHLAPFHRSVRLDEAAAILEGVPAAHRASAVTGVLAEMRRGQPVVVSGDFNALSPLDREHHRAGQLLERQQATAKPFRATSLAPDGSLDYSVMERFLQGGLVDVAGTLLPVAAERFSYPTDLHESVVASAPEAAPRFRIDHLLATPRLARRALRATYVHGPTVEHLSDHYPLVVDFSWPMA